MTALAHTRDRQAASQAASQLRILRVADVPRSATAGVSGYMLRSGAAIEARGHSVSYWFRSDLAPRIAHPGIRRLLVPWAIAAKVILEVARGQRADVVEIHEPLAAVYGVLARAIRALPACAVLSHGLETRGWHAQTEHLAVHGRRPPLRSRILVPLTLLSQARVALSSAEAILCVASADRDYAVSKLGVPAQRVSCAFGGVSEDLFDVPRQVQRGPRVLFLGSWIERKGTVELSAAWRRVADAHPDARLTIAGAGNGDCARADMRGVAGVEVIDAIDRDDLPGLLANHDLFVLPSWFEGLPLSMLEAAAGGLGCAVSGICGVLDVFRPGDPEADGARLVAPSDAEALYRTLEPLVADGEARRALGERARARARSFTWARNAEQSIAAYAAAIERRTRVAITAPASGR